MSNLRRILSYMSEYKGKVILAISLLILFICFNFVTPHIARILIDDVIKGGKREILSSLLIAIVALSILKGVSVYFRNYFMEDVSQSCIYTMRNQLYKHLQNLSFSFYDNNRIGELMSRMTGDLEGIRMFIKMGVQMFLENVVYFIGTLIILFSMNAELALVSLIATPFLALGAYSFHKKVRPVFDKIREQQAVLNTTCQENIAGVRVVKAFAREEHEKERFKKENRKNMNNSIKAGILWSRYFPIMEFMSGFCAIALLWYGGRMVAQGTITLGTVVAFNSYLWMLIMPMRTLGMVINLMERATASAERVFTILDTDSCIKNVEDPYTEDDCKGDVVFDNVGFKYRDEQVLKGIDIKAERGKTIAVMGATGAGKTSIINLINRFYDVSEGAIRIDGVDVKDWDMDVLRDHIGIVMQDTFLFSDTIEGNIKYGKPDASLEEVVEAAKVAEADDFIQEMPNGYDTIVGERGLGLSGGQKQRIAIARAIVKNPKILIMDDCTSAVDMETEHRIQRALKKVMKDRTTFIIAHRISSVKDADEIIMLENGRIIERGNHSQLLKQRGYYYNIYKQQYKDFETESYGEKVM